MARVSLASSIVPDHAICTQEARLLDTLQDLMRLPALELRPALMAAATRVGEALGCEKVDAFLLDESRATLQAEGTSDTPMGHKQHALGLDTLALANGGRVVQAFERGESYIEHHSEQDPNELRGIVEGLGVRSTMGVPLHVGGVRRGILAAASADPEFFTDADLRFFETVAHWVAALAQRAELAERARAVEAEQARRRGADEIITVLAHDFRNLLQPLLGRLQAMRMALDAGGPVSPAQLDRALRAGQRLSRLTDDLLDLKRLDEGLFTLTLSPVDVATLARETAQNLGTAATPVQVTGVESLVIVADQNRLRQVLENLVSNAVRYSPPDTQVEVRITAEATADAPDAVIEVQDAGPGIAPEVLSTLFDRYSPSSDSRGLGLGLHITCRIARAHGGTLTAHPRPTRGTTFRLRIPGGPADGVGGTR